MVCSVAYPEAPLWPMFNTGASCGCFPGAAAAEATSASSAASPAASEQTSRYILRPLAAVMCSCLIYLSSRFALPLPSVDREPVSLRPSPSGLQQTLLHGEHDHTRGLAPVEVVVANEHERLSSVGQNRPEGKCFEVVQERV